MLLQEENMVLVNLLQVKNTLHVLMLRLMQMLLR